MALAGIVVLVVLGATLRAGAIGGDTHVSADEQGYVANANHLLAGSRYATFKWPPGTSVVFAAATAASGHGSLRLQAHASGPAQYAQLALGLLTLLAVAWLAWAAAGPWAGLAATALLAGYLPLVLATRTFLSEPAGALALVGAVGTAAWAHSRLGKPRQWQPLCAAGAVGALACLTRGDLAVGAAVIALGLALAGRPGWRTGAARAGVYLGTLVLLLAPWLAYASGAEHRFVPLTTAGPDAFFIGTYLPGDGALVPTEEKLAPQVCRRFPHDCGAYWQRSAEPLFALIRARHPRLSADAAVRQASLENLRRYALGRPGAFLSMLWHKYWSMWGTVWSGGNGTRHRDTSQTQHTLYLLAAWAGLLLGVALTRRWWLAVSAAVLVSIASLATLFNDQPRYNVSLMPLLFTAGAAGAVLAARHLLARRAPGRRPS